MSSELAGGGPEGWSVELDPRVSSNFAAARFALAPGVTVLRGVEIGSYCVVGARSILTRGLPDHTLAFGQPATPRGRVGDRSRAR